MSAIQGAGLEEFHSIRYIIKTAYCDLALQAVYMFILHSQVVASVWLLIEDLLLYQYNKFITIDFFN